LDATLTSNELPKHAGDGSHFHVGGIHLRLIVVGVDGAASREPRSPSLRSMRSLEIWRLVAKPRTDVVTPLLSCARQNPERHKGAREIPPIARLVGPWTSRNDDDQPHRS